MICALADVKAYMQVTDDGDDALITSLIEAAEGYLADAGIRPSEPVDARYALAVSALTLHWYDNRQAVDTNLTDLPLGLRQVINQLKAKGVRESEA